MVKGYIFKNGYNIIFIFLIRMYFSFFVYESFRGVYYMCYINRLVCRF